MSRRRASCHLNRLVLLVCCICAVGAGEACVYDASDRCSPSQVMQDGFCVCAAGSGLDARTNTCAPCGEHQVVVGTVCACASDYALDAATGACVFNRPGLGDACGAGAPCSHAENPACHVPAGGTGYCTTEACTSDADCGGAYRCDLVASPPYCRRPTLGEGQVCTSDADCAGNEATWCAISSPRMCAMRDCTLGSTNECFVGEICCDMSRFVSFGVPSTLCTPPASCPN
jgi:hypothetical protein